MNTLRIFLLYFLVLAINLPSRGQCPTTDFSIPSTACIGGNLPIENITEVSVTYEWDFCSGDLETTPVVSELLTVSSASSPRGIKLIFDGTDWWGFVLSRINNKIFRLNFGSSLSNTPSVKDMGNIGSLLSSPDGIDIIKEGTNWYGLIVNNGNSVLLMSFGSTLNNDTPEVSKLTIGASILDQPRVIDIVQEETHVFALVGNFSSNKITLLDFGASINNLFPSFTNISIAGISGLMGISVIKDCDNYYGITSSYNSGEIHKLNFGNSILNTPTSSVLSTTVANPGNLKLVKEGSNFYGLIPSFSGALHKFSFGNTFSNNTSTYQNLGNFSLLSGTFGFDVVQDESSYYCFPISTSSNKIHKVKFETECSSSIFTDTSITPAPSYSSPGTYPITLTAYDEAGNSSSITKSITVTDNIAPSIEFSNTTQCITDPITFTGSSDQTITSYSWDFGDETTATGEEVSHQYTTPGAYKVRLTVESDNGCGNFIEKEVNIYPAPAPDFAFPTTSICTNGEISFTNITPGEYKEEDITWLWDFGDGETSEEKNPNHTYTTGGTKTVKLTAAIPGCTASKSYDLQVMEGPSVNFVEDNLCFEEEVQFTNLSTGDDITTYAWDFGNEVTSTEVNPTIVYDAPGVYEVSLTVENGLGCSNTFTKSVTINALPEVSFDYGSACNGSPVQFQDQSTIANGNVGSWLWKFGDGTESTSKNPAHTYAEEGSYDVKLIVTTVAGCIDSVLQTVSVNVSPVADFEVALGCPGSLTQFTETSQDPGGDGITVNYWIINGIYHYTQNPAVLFTKSGTYAVTLAITSGSSCKSLVTRNIIIDPLPTANFAFDDTCIGEVTTFSDQSQVIGDDEIESWNWRFSEFATSNEQNPEFEFPAVGDYPVTLTVTSKRGCSAIINKTVTINSLPEAAFSPQSNFGAPPLSVSFTNTSSGAINYQWWFGDAENSTSEEVAPTFVYTEVGDYEVTMVARSAGGCVDTTYATIHVLISEIDVALENINVFTNTGNMQIVLTLTNNGTVPISNMNINLDLGGAISLNERFSEIIYPGQSYNYPVGFDILEKDLPNVPYICVSLSVVEEGLEEEVISDNSLCQDISGMFVLTDPYPNPVNHTFNLEFFMPENVPVQVTIIDMLGKSVVNSDLADTKAGFNKYNYDFSDFAAGIYFVRISHKNDNYIRKVVVQ